MVHANLDSLRKFARRKHISEEVVVAVFETERHRLTQRAKVEGFVDVLAEKRARRVLRRMDPKQNWAPAFAGATVLPSDSVT